MGLEVLYIGLRQTWHTFCCYTLLLVRKSVQIVVHEAKSKERDICGISCFYH